jgi:hypothetical protein
MPWTCTAISSPRPRPVPGPTSTVSITLAQEGVDLTRAAVGLYDYTGGAQKVCLYKASNFLQDINYGFALLLANDNEIYQRLAALSANNGW